jgi:LytS/YehU family sensor histidine kinase
VIDNQIDEALKYIGEFSKLIRQTLHFSSRTRIRLEEEIDFLHRYMELDNLRRNNKVNARISAADHLDLSELEIPPMLLQPLIENVFIHAFDSQSKDPKVDIKLDGKTDELICKISDNGKGFQKETNAKQSKGIKLVDERIRLLTGSVEKMVQILANPDGGTVIILTIPLR